MVPILANLFNGLKKNTGLDLEIVKRSDDMKGFQVLPRRWVVERTFVITSYSIHYTKLYEAYVFLKVLKA